MSNVALLSEGFPPSLDGVANVVLNYADRIEKNYGHSVVVTPKWPGADDSGYSYPVIRYPSIDTRNIIGYVTGAPFAPTIAEDLRREGVELLHSHCPSVSQILSRELRPRLNVPLVFTYHTKYDIDIRRAVHGKLLQDNVIRAMVENIEASDEVWVVSRGAGENLKSLGYRGDYIVMNNGVDLPLGRVSEEKIREATGDYDLPAGVPVFLFVGRMLWYKGQRLILEALEALKFEGQDFRMVFIGAGENLQDIIDLSEELKISDKCIFTGAIRDREALRAWYCRADAFLFPSSFDTNGLVVREAAACSLATVMIKDSCASEGVTDGVNGFMMTENAASLAILLYKLCQNPGKMKEVGANAARDLYYSWDEAVAAANDRYLQILDNQRCGLYEKPGIIREFRDEFLRSEAEFIEIIDKLIGREN